LCGASLVWNLWSEREAVLDQARSEARGLFYQDATYRSWATGHGGVYVPVTDSTPVSPYLAHVPERDITTPSGRRLTLINPAYMTRQVQELSYQQQGVRGHITSLRALRPGNEPDPWEAEALQAFEEGKDEVWEVVEQGEAPYLRFMRPFYTEKGCLKCHGHQGYKEGEVRGGISLAVPLSTYFSLRDEMSISLWLWHCLLYLAGLSFIIVAARMLNTRIRENQTISHALSLDNERNLSLLALSGLGMSTEEELVAFALEEVVRLSESEVGYFHYYDEESRTIRLFSWSKKVMDHCSVGLSESMYPLEQAGVWADCIRRRGGVIHNDYVALPDKKELPQGHFSIRRHMSVAIMENERIVAIAGVGNKAQPYGDDDVTQLTVYMQRAWDVIKARRTRGIILEQETDLLLSRALVDQSGDTIFIISPKDGRFLDVNASTCAMLGYLRQEILQLGIKDIDVGLPEDFSWDALIEELRHKPNILFESRHRRKDGSTFPVERNIRLIVHEGEEYVIASARDISERKATEEELEGHRHHLETLVKERTATLEEKSEALERSHQAMQFLLEDMAEARKALEAKLAEIERMNRIFVARELRMIELKERIRALEERL
jgi:PAS domain S-box-containing protein